MTTERFAAFRGKRVLVTGGAGFIGSNLAHRLVAEGAEVCVVDCLVPDLGGNRFNLESILDQIRFEQTDLRDFNSALLIVHDFDYVFNVLGNVSHHDSMSKPALDMSINVNAQLNVLEACRLQNKDAVVVYTSTRQIYGVPQYRPVDEKHPLSPIDVNGINKLAAEQYHLVYSSAYGMKTVSLRLTNTYGPRQLIRHSRQGFIAWFVNRVLTDHKIQLYGGGTQLRDLTYVDDVVEALMLSALSKDCYGQAFNLSGHRASLADIAGMLVEAAGRGEIESIPFPDEKKRIDIGDYYADASRIHAATGWEPATDLKKGLRRMIDYYKAHSHHYIRG